MRPGFDDTSTIPLLIIQRVITTVSRSPRNSLPELFTKVKILKPLTSMPVRLFVKHEHRILDLKQERKIRVSSTK